MKLRTTVFLVALVPFLALAWRFDFLCDDAFITFRYARNLARGNGLVFNLGVAPPVEGYSEFLWALLLGAGTAIGVSPLVLSRVLSLLAGVLLVFVTTRLLVERSARTPLASIGAAAFLGLLPPLAVWSTSGLATMPFAAALVVLFDLLWRRDEPASALRIGIIASVAALLRADGAWWVAWIVGTAIAAGALRGERERWRRAAIGAAFAAAVFALHVAWRYATYGDWVPNTARAKVGVSARAASRGADYLIHFFLTMPGIVLALATIVASSEWRERRLVPALVAVGATFVYAVLVGGDFMAFGRFLVPGLPFVVLALGTGLSGLEARAGRGAAIALAAACTVMCALPAYGRTVTPTDWRRAFGFRHNNPLAAERGELEQWRLMAQQKDEWADAGRALALVSGPEDSLVFGAVGAVGYYSDLFIYDRNGLVTREVALREPLDQKRSPGHDKTVPVDFFRSFAPTWLDVSWYSPERWREVQPSATHLREIVLPEGRSPRPELVLVGQPGDGAPSSDPNGG